VPEKNGLKGMKVLKGMKKNFMFCLSLFFEEPFLHALHALDALQSILFERS
jgi:hypothetical protein